MRGFFMSRECTSGFDMSSPFDEVLLPVAVGMVLRLVRDHKRLTQADLASLADMNLSYISNVENGQNNISIIKFCQLCNALLVPSNDVLQKACQQLGTLRLLIRNRTPREAVSMLRQNSTVSQEIGALIKAGDSGKDPKNNDQNPTGLFISPS
jgi:transcriptional regulator with XRE-family HTH domain